MRRLICLSNRGGRLGCFLVGALFSMSGSTSGQTSRLELELVSSALVDPVGLANAGDESGRLFVVERAGRIRIIEPDGTLGPLFLDITDRVRSVGGEQGLLGLAFHPNYVGNGFFYVNTIDGRGDTKVSRFTASTIGAVDPATEAVILSLTQPASNHNGGHLAFGPDGFLYIGLGDGGGGGDTYRNGQNGRTLLGAMLRIDVDAARSGRWDCAILGDTRSIARPEISTSPMWDKTITRK
jgi:glucose/arabinose dehydrogenase